MDTAIFDYSINERVHKSPILRYQYIKYLPMIVGRINTPNTITEIKVSNQDVIYDTANSNLVIDGQIIGKGIPLTSANYKTIQFVQNGIMHLYSQIKYLISSKEVEVVMAPGYTTTIKVLTTFNKQDMFDGWRTENFLDEKVYFSITVPLKNIFGVFETYNKAILRVSQELQLLRATDDLNCLLAPVTLKDNL